MKDLIDFENNYRFFTEQKQLDLLYLVTAKIKEKILSNDEIVDLLKDVDAEMAHDILKILLSQKYINNDDYNEIDTNLIKIYEQDFIKDFSSGVIEERLKFKLNKNKRLISRYEILGIYFSKTLDSKPLFGIGESEDPLINNLADINKKLCLPRLTNMLLKKQFELVDSVLKNLIEELNKEKKEVNV